LRNKYAELERQIYELRIELQQKLLEHFEYHRENESKWGLVKIMREHPFKTLLIGILIGLGIVGLIKIDNLLSLIVKLF